VNDDLIADRLFHRIQDLSVDAAYHGPTQVAPERHEIAVGLAWIVLGLLAGFIASHLINRHGEGMVLDILLGIVGAIIGGWLAQMFGFSGVTRFNLYSLIVATCGAIVLLFVYHAIRRSMIGRRFL
jgi:uncharacterized membrane protein YeaQ/YmgE (transglycosylase-associated protein family)